MCVRGCRVGDLYGDNREPLSRRSAVLKDPQPLFANPEVFFSTLIAHFAEPLAHYGKLVHEVLSLLENAHGGLVAGEPFRESGKKSIPVTALLQSKVLKSSRAAENQIAVASSGGLSRRDGRCYSKWFILCQSRGYFGEPHRSAASPLCRLELNVSLSLVKKMGSARYIQLVNEVFALCAAHTPECMYGFVDIMSAAESSGGRCYSDLAAGGDWCSWHRLLEQYDWAYQEERRYGRTLGVHLK